MFHAAATTLTLVQHELVNATAVFTANDPTPEAEDVKAGWTGFAVFIGLILVTALICWSFYKQMKRVNANKAAGVYGDVEEPTSTEGSQNS